MTDEGPDHASGLQSVADRHGVSIEAVRHLMRALEAGNGTMAQFDHPDLGGLGQWFLGGMVMVGRMFDDGLKAKVAALCAELAEALPPGGWDAPRSAGARGAAHWWPAGLGRPSTEGSQNGLRYAYFPAERRLAVETPEGVTLYDTGEHHISGAAQSNGAFSFTSSLGAVDLTRLRRIAGGEASGGEASGHVAGARHAPAEPIRAPAPEPAAPAGGRSDDVLATIERLAELHRKGVLTEREFSDKKAELLARL
ncbi:SHOCT domain-containing protein [Methylobacterium sp. A54F]